MRILMLNPFYYPYSGGTEKHLLEVSTRLAKKHDVSVLTARLPGTKRHEILGGVNVIRVRSLLLNKLPYPFPPPVPASPFFLTDLLSQLPRHDLFHFHNRFFYNLLDFSLPKRLAGKKTALTLHNARVSGISKAADAIGGLYDDTLGRAMMSSVDAIAAVSRNTLELTVPLELQAGATVIYNGVDPQVFSPRNEGSRAATKYRLQGKQVILSVARFEEQKGLDYLLHAFAKVKKIHRRAVLVLLGRGSKEMHLRSEARRLGISGSVVFVTGRLPEKELAQVYAACDVFVLPSVWEPFGMALIEAMASGKPVIGSRVGGIPEIVTKESGLLFEPRNAVDLEGKILQLLGDSRLRKRLGLAARRRAEKVFTWDNAAKGYLKMYAPLEQ